MINFKMLKGKMKPKTIEDIRNALRLTRNSWQYILMTMGFLYWLEHFVGLKIV